MGMSRSLTLISQMMQSSLRRMDILLGAFEMLNEESETLGLQVSWVKTKIQAFNDIFDAAILPVPVCGEDVEVTERFTSLGSDITVSAGCEPEFNRHPGWAWGVMDSLDHGVWRCRYLCKRTKVLVFSSLMLPVLLDRSEIRILTRDSKTET